MMWLEKIKKKWMKLRLQPIRVFCLHHVCESFDAESMREGDWMALEDFKQKVLDMQHSGMEFISLSEAQRKCKMEYVRWKRYAVLTFDDGYASLKEVLPWLKGQGIPVTLFINPDYAAGKAYRESPKEQYLTPEDLAELDVEIGMHGFQHLDVTKMSEDEFREFVEQSYQQSSIINQQSFIPFWAYTWGRHNVMTDRVLRDKGIIPVYVDGMKNYNDATCIHRELLDNYKLEKKLFKLYVSFFRTNQDSRNRPWLCGIAAGTSL